MFKGMICTESVSLILTYDVNDDCYLAVQDDADDDDDKEYFYLAVHDDDDADCYLAVHSDHSDHMNSVGSGQGFSLQGKSFLSWN